MKKLIPERRHGDDGVPERDGDAGEVGAGHVLLGVEHDGREDDDGHGEREDEEAKLRSTRLERVAEDAQTSRVTRELENPSLNNTPRTDLPPTSGRSSRSTKLIYTGPG